MPDNAAEIDAPKLLAAIAMAAPTMANNSAYSAAAAPRSSERISFVQLRMQAPKP